MQNEPNWKIDPMNVTKVSTTDYNSWTLSAHGKNEPKTNPNEPNLFFKKPGSERQNQHFDKIYKTKNMQNKANERLFCRTLRKKILFRTFRPKKTLDFWPEICSNKSTSNGEEGIRRSSCKSRVAVCFCVFAVCGFCSLLTIKITTAYKNGSY